MREAIIEHDVDIDRVRAYLPENYDVEVRPELHGEGDTLVIFGTDHFGWTLDGYVIPRLASGMIFAKETT